MKTKRDAKERKSEMEFKQASKDITWEYERLVDDDILDELALAEVLEDEE